MSKSQEKIDQIAKEPEKWKRYIQIRCRECEICGKRWEWIPSLTKHRVPVMKVDNVTVSVRRALYRIEKGVDAHKARGVTTNCQNSKCINPAFLVQLTKSQLVERTAKAGKYSNVSKSIKIAGKKRNKSKLSQDGVRDIVTQQETAKVYADRYNITPAYVYMLWRGLFRKEHGSPFSGLLAA